MKVFFDTSSLFKLYHKESGTQELMDFFNNNPIETIEYYFTSDNILKELSEAEGLKTR